MTPLRWSSPADGKCYPHGLLYRFQGDIYREVASAVYKRVPLCNLANQTSDWILQPMFLQAD